MHLRSSLLSAALLAATVTPGCAGDAPLLGHSIHGSGPEKVIVFHNWMGDATSFDSLRPWLDESKYTFAFVDVRGYGASKHLEGDYNSDETSTDALRLIDHLGWEQYHIVGHSMNAMTSAKMVMHEEKNDKRVKSFTAITPVTPDGYPATQQDKDFLLAVITDDEMAKMGYGGLTGGKLHTTWAEKKTDYFRKVTNKKALRGYYDMWLTEDFSAEFIDAEIQTPVLVIGGRNDLPGFQQAHYDETLAKWIPNVRFEFIDNAGHYPMIETPVLTAALITSHIDAHK